MKPRCGTSIATVVGSGHDPHERGHQVSELEDDLRSIAETMSAEAERLSEIERFKATLEPGDPRLVGLAEESEGLAKDLARMAAAETHLAKEAVEAG